MGYFDDDELRAAPVLQAIGRAVLYVSSLEKGLQFELSRLTLAAEDARGPKHGSDPRLVKRLSDMDKMTAGRMLAELRTFGLPADLDARIDTVVKRRNDLIHHPMEDAELMSALAGDAEHRDAVLERIDQLALHAAELASESYTCSPPLVSRSSPVCRCKTLSTWSTHSTRSRSTTSAPGGRSRRYKPWASVVC
jgi:hypothetical protein